MTAQRRLSGALALTCVTAALAPATAGARPAIDSPGPRDATAATCTEPMPRAATTDCNTSSDFEAFAIVLAGGGVLLVGGGHVARSSVRHRRAGRIAVTRP